MEIWTPFLEASVRLATPLLLAALGELVSERAGVLNIGLEGSIIAGALGGVMAAIATGSPILGVAAGALCGLSVALVFALVSVVWGADQIITGTAVTLVGLGGTGIIYQEAFGVTGAALTVPTLGAWAVPVLSQLPLVGPAFFNQAPTAYAAFLLAPLLAYTLLRTGLGLRLRSVGEHPDAAAAAGVPVVALRVLAVLFAGLCAGLAGAHLALAHAGTFAEGMSAGRGFIAIAIVVLGRWRPMWVLAAALFFGAASALQFFLQSLGLVLPYPLFLGLPYLLTLIALAVGRGRNDAPGALAVSWPDRRSSLSS